MRLSQKKIHLPKISGCSNVVKRLEERKQRNIEIFQLLR
jgi:predicted CopG family antitoxin